VAVGAQATRVSNTAAIAIDLGRDIILLIVSLTLCSKLFINLSETCHYKMRRNQKQKLALLPRTSAVSLPKRNGGNGGG
jgi:hypothetical protein